MKKLVIIALIWLTLPYLYIGQQMVQIYADVRVHGGSHNQAICELGQLVDNTARIAGLTDGKTLQIKYYTDHCQEGTFY